MSDRHIADAHRERIRGLKVTDPVVQAALAGFICAALREEHGTDVPAPVLHEIISDFGQGVAVALDAASAAYNAGWRPPR